jgi:hypothetical protein
MAMLRAAFCGSTDASSHVVKGGAPQYSSVVRVSEAEYALPGETLAARESCGRDVAAPTR